MTTFGFDDSAFKKSTATIFVALLIAGFVPIINLIRIIPMFKEIILGAAVVAVFTQIEEGGEAIKFALITGMIAAVLFNIIYIPGQFILGGLMASAGGATTDQAGMMAALQGLGALLNIIGLLIFSPIGYVIGGALGSVFN